MFKMHAVKTLSPMLQNMVPEMKSIVKHLVTIEVFSEIVDDIEY